MAVADKGLPDIPAGSRVLKSKFEDYIKSIVGDEQFLVLKKEKGYAAAIRTFDREVVPGFTGDPSKSWFIHFPMAGLEDDPVNNLKADVLHLK